MHVFISDTHMTDHPASGSVSDVELTNFAGDIEKWAEHAQIKLVLLGDIIDFLRSPKWKHCWEHCNHSFPWSTMNSHFTNFVDNYAETYALEIAQAVTTRYSGFSKALKKLTDSGRVKIVYVVGNHDYMLQLSPKLREAVCTFLSLSDETNVAKKAFPTIYADEGASVYATHGNSYDPTNYHRFDEGYWAFGDAVVLQLINRFAPETCAALGSAETTVIGKHTHELDNIQPASDVPVYVRWLADEFLTSPDEKRKVLEVWSRIVTELLELPVFKHGYEDPCIQRDRTALEISKSTSFSELVAKYASYFQGQNYKNHAEDLAATLGNKYRFILFGHTHHPMLVPLPFSVKGQQGYYVNTGCWRRVVSRPSPKERGPFAAVRVNAFFRIDDAESGASRYYLSQQCYTS